MKTHLFPLIVLVALGCPREPPKLDDDDPVIIDSDTDPIEDTDDPIDTAIDGDPIRIGSFNIDWLWESYGDGFVPRNATDYEMISQLIVELDLDLIALQEINTEASLDLLSLPGEYAYVVGSTGWSQNLAVLYRTDTLYLSDMQEIDLPGSTSSDRHPLLTELNTLDNSLTFSFINVHFKASADNESANRRRTQINNLHTWLTDSWMTQSGTTHENVLIAGDWNDSFEGINDNIDTLQIFEDDPTFLFTWQTEAYTYIPYRGQIDHIVMTNNLVENWVEAELQGCVVFAHDRTSPYQDYSGGYGGDQNISSHRPVWISLAP